MYNNSSNNTIYILMILKLLLYCILYVISIFFMIINSVNIYLYLDRIKMLKGNDIYFLGSFEHVPIYVFIETFFYLAL